MDYLDHKVEIDETKYAQGRRVTTLHAILFEAEQTSCFKKNFTDFCGKLDRSDRPVFARISTADLEKACEGRPDWERWLVEKGFIVLILAPESKKAYAAPPVNASAETKILCPHCRTRFHVRFLIG